MSHVVVHPNGCWYWSAYRMKNGYGLFRYPSGHQLAHRVSHRLFNGPIPDGADVMHACDNPACVNPSHLSTGSRAENMADAKAKGRMATGTRHPKAKLTIDQVRAIRGSTELQRTLAMRYGVAQSAISKIKTGLRWSALN